MEIYSNTSKVRQPYEKELGQKFRIESDNGKNITHSCYASVKRTLATKALRNKLNVSKSSI